MTINHYDGAELLELSNLDVEPDSVLGPDEDDDESEELVQPSDDEDYDPDMVDSDSDDDLDNA